VTAHPPPGGAPAAPEATLIVDPQGRASAWNAAWCELLPASARKLSPPVPLAELAALLGAPASGTLGALLAGHQRNRPGDDRVTEARLPDGSAVSVRCTPLVGGGFLAVVQPGAPAETTRMQHLLLRSQELTRVGSWQWAPDTGEMLWSAETFRIFGMEAVAGGELTFEQSMERFAPADQVRVQEAIEAGRKTGEFPLLELGVRQPDGSWKRVRAAARMERDAQGNPWRLYGTLQDVTDVRRVEEDLRIRDGALQTSLNAVAMADLSGRLTYVNQSFLDMWGFDSAEEVLGRSAEFLWEDPADREAILSALRTHRRYVGEMTMRRRDGTEFEVQLLASVATDAEGRSSLMMGSFIDITDRKRAEQAIREKEQSLLMAQQVAHVGSWERDIRQGTLYWSDEVYRIFGLQPQEFRGSRDAFLERVHPADRPALERALARAIAGEAPYEFEHRVVRPDGTVRHVLERGEVLRDAQGKPQRLLGAVMDITEQREAMARIEQLNRELEDRVRARTEELRAAQSELLRKERLATVGQLTAMVSHELRNPLGTIGNSLFILRHQLADAAGPVGETLERVARSIERCNRIIDEMLDFTRARPLSPRPTAFDGWLQGVAAEMVVPEGIRLRVTPGAAGAQVALDPHRFQRVVINLLENAFQAIQEQQDGAAPAGTVEVATRLAGGRLEFTVADSGPGIASGAAEQVYEPLFSTKNFGVGLGLPIVRQIVEAHGGEFHLANRQPPPGALARVTLPLGAPGAPAAG